MFSCARKKGAKLPAEKEKKWGKNQFHAFEGRRDEKRGLCARTEKTKDKWERSCEGGFSYLQEKGEKIPQKT